MKRGIAMKYVCDDKDTRFAQERYHFISNNDAALRKVATLIENEENVEIDFEGKAFCYEEPILPIVISGSKHVTLKNFSINFKMPFYFQGTVMAIDEETNSFDLEVLDECIYEVRGQKMYFRGKVAERPFQGTGRWPASTVNGNTWEQDILWNMWFNEDGTTILDERKRIILETYQVEQLENGWVRWIDAMEELPEVGQRVIIKGKKDKNRMYPGIFIENSEDVRIENATIYHSCGMALIAQRSKDITLKNYAVRIPEGSKRICSASADGSHFNACGGDIVMEDCYFENMLDDALNVHGTYVIVKEICDDHTVLCQFGHSQQQGHVFAAAGDVVRSFHAHSLECLNSYTVEDIEFFNSVYFKITTKESIDGKLKEGMVLDNGTWQPSVTIRNCTVKHNRARGLLLQSNKPILVENSLFDGSSAQGIQFAGEASFWYESGHVADVTIQNNTFKNLRDYIININTATDGSAIYHKNIRVINNEIESIHTHMIFARCVDNLEFSNNKITIIDDVKKDGIIYNIENCGNVIIENNQVEVKVEVPNQKF